MKRDLDLIKNILLALEKDENPFDWKTELIGTENDIKYFYHVNLLSEAGLIKAKSIQTKRCSVWYPISLTSEGHEILEASKNVNVWKKVKEVAKNEGITLPFNLLKEFIKLTLKNELGL